MKINKIEYQSNSYKNLIISHINKNSILPTIKKNEEVKSIIKMNNISFLDFRHEELTKLSNEIIKNLTIHRSYYNSSFYKMFQLEAISDFDTSSQKAVITRLSNKYIMPFSRYALNYAANYSSSRYEIKDDFDFPSFIICIDDNLGCTSWHEFQIESDYSLYETRIETYPSSFVTIFTDFSD